MWDLSHCWGNLWTSPISAATLVTIILPPCTKFTRTNTDFLIRNVHSWLIFWSDAAPQRYPSVVKLPYSRGASTDLQSSFFVGKIELSHSALSTIYALVLELFQFLMQSNNSLIARPRLKKWPGLRTTHWQDDGLSRMMSVWTLLHLQPRTSNECRWGIFVDEGSVTVVAIVSFLSSCSWESRGICFFLTNIFIVFFS